MRVRMETVQTVFFDMPIGEAVAVLEAITQHLADEDQSNFGSDDPIHIVFEFQEKLRRSLNAFTRS